MSLIKKQVYDDQRNLHFCTKIRNRRTNANERYVLVPVFETEPVHAVFCRYLVGPRTCPVPAASPGKNFWLAACVQVTHTVGGAS